MKIERTKNAKKGIIWGMIVKIIGLMFPFLVRTTIIETIGFEYIGLNGLFTSVLELLNLTELGVGTAIVFSMYKPIAEDDEDTICALMNLFKKLYRIIGTIVLVFGLSLLPFLDLFINGDVPSNVNLKLLYLIYLSNSVITYWMFAYKTCLLNAHQRIDVVNKVNLVLTSILYISQILVLIFLKNYYIYIVLLPLTSFFINIIDAYFANKLFPRYRCRGIVSKDLQFDIGKRIGGLLLTKIAYKFRYSLGNIIVSAVLGLHIISIYNNYFYLMTAIAGLFTVVTTALTAGIGNSIAMESNSKNENDMKVLSFIYMSFSFLCFCCLLSFYQPFMYLWVGEENMFSSTIMILFATFFLIDKLLNIVGIYYDAAGLWWKGKYKGLIEASVHILLTIVLTKLYGVAGTLIAGIISVIFIGFPLTSFYMYKYYFSKSASRYILQYIFSAFIMLTIGLIPYLLINEVIIETIDYNKYGLIILSIIASLSISLSLFFAIFYRTDIYKQSKDWIKIHLKL